MKLNLINNS